MANKKLYFRSDNKCTRTLPKDSPVISCAPVTPGPRSQSQHVHEKTTGRRKELHNAVGTQ